jgi:predicted transcriptional regulator
MSSIIRIAVLCLLLAAIPCITAASDNGDHNHGPETGDVSGSDYPVGDSGETRDPGEQNANRDSPPPPTQDSPEQQDQLTPRDAASSGKDGGSINPEESGKDSSSDQKNDVEDASQKTASPERGEEKSPRCSRDRHQSPETRDITSEKPDGEMHNEDSEKELSGKSDTRSGETESKDYPVMLGRIVQTLSDENEGGPGDQDDIDPFAQKAPMSATQIPEQAPYNEPPFANIPALPAGGLPISSTTSGTDRSRLIVRNKNKDEHESFWKPTDSSFVMSPLMLLKLWCFLGFRRVVRKNVLESGERRSLYENITKYPGVDLSRLTEMLRLNKETARYHLKMLAVNGKISGLIKQGIARYFPCREVISEFEKTVIHYLWIRTTKRILLLLIETPGLTRQAIAKELGIAGPSVTWQMQRLADDGLIEIRTEGRFVRYFLTPRSAEVLEFVNKSDGWTKLIP